jgi:tetratricopeptide (TPR) repeat protein
MKFRGLILGCMLGGFLVPLLPGCALAQATPSAFDHVVGAATAARERDDVPQAIELYSRAVQLRPRWPDGWWFLGSLQYQAEAYAASRDALTHLLELVPDAAPAWALRGLCEFETGEYSQSLTDIQRGLSLGAGKQAHDETILRYHEALLLTRSGNFEQGLQEFAPFTRSKVSNPELLVGIGLAGLRTPLLPRDLKEDKRDLYLAAGSAAFLFMSGDEAAARQEFQNLFQRFPTASDAHYLYGLLLFPTDPDQAIAEFRRELEIAPSNAAAQLMVAWDALMRNDFSTALAYSEKVMAEEPTLPSARLVLGRGLVETGDVKGGIDLLEKELRLEPDNFEIHLALARAYSKSGRKEDARRERLQCLQMEKNATTHEVRR